MMPFDEEEEEDQELKELLERMPPADWVLKMQADYEQTGTYAAEDLLRLLGDPTSRLTVGGEESFPQLEDAWPGEE